LKVISKHKQWKSMSFDGGNSQAEKQIIWKID